MIALVTDSTAYLTREEAKALQVHIAPMSYTVNGRIYHETYIDKSGDYETLIARGIAEAKTSQTTVGTFTSLFDELLQQGHDVLCLTISSRLSGTYSSAALAARELDKERITVVDSHLTGGGLYLLVHEARRLIDAGLDRGAIMSELCAIRDRIGIAFSVSDLTQLRKSGRLGIVRQSISTMLNNKPVFLCLEGAIVSDGVSRGRNAQLAHLLRHVPKDATSIIVHYTLQEEHSASLLAKTFGLSHPGVPLHMSLLGPVLDIHLGLSTVGIAWITPA